MLAQLRFLMPKRGPLWIFVLILNSLLARGADPEVVTAETAPFPLDLRPSAPAAAVSAIAELPAFALDTRPVTYGTGEGLPNAITPAFAANTFCAELPAGLVSWWRGEGNAVDSASDFDGQAVGTVTYVAGKVGQAFNTANGYLRMAGGGSVEGFHLTIAAWARSGAATAEQHILNKAFNAARGSYSLSINPSGGMRFSVASNSESIEVVSPALTWDNQWHYFAGTFDGSALRIYVDGELMAETPLTTGIAWSQEYLGGDLFIGAASDNPAPTRWLGAIDEVILSSRALTGAEIAAIYQAGATGICAEPAITVQPIARTVPEGGTLSLSVTATSATPATYQWHFNGAPLEGFTASTLTIDNVTTQRQGLYRVVISNAYGSVTSAEVQVLVETCAPPPENMFAWWQAEGNIGDSVGGLSGAGTAGLAYIAGVVGQAFQTQNGFLRVPNTPRLAPQNLSVSMWLKGPPTGNFQYPIVKAHNGSYSSYACYVSGGTIYFYIGTASTYYEISAAITWDTRWRHVAATYDGSILRLWLDGAQAAQRTVNLPIAYSSALAGGDLYIGSHPAGTARSWPGGLDEVALFDRALSAAEIQAIYDAAELGICRGPTITTFPVDTSATAGEEARLQVAATSPLPLRYQWQREGVNVENGTSATLVLPGVRTDQSGRYRVIVSDDAGSIRTAYVYLQVDTCVDRPLNLAGRWRGDGSVAASFGGFASQADLSVTYEPGMVGQAIRTTAGKVRVTNHADLAPAGITASMWVKATSIGAFQYALAKSFNNASASYAIYTGPSGAGLQFYIMAGGSSRAAAATLAWDNQWRHVAGTYDGSIVRIYIDGALAGSSAPINLPLHYASTFQGGDLFIGGFSENLTTYNWPGFVDDVLLFSRALSAAEIQALYNARSASLCAGPVITAHPQGRTVAAGENVTFEVTANSELPLRYQWQFNEADLPGQTAPALLLNAVTAQQSGRYRVVVSDDAGTVFSNEAVLEVEGCAPAPAGLVGWWQGEGSANDAIGALSGTALGTPTFNFGNVGQGIHTSVGYFRISNQSRFQSPNFALSAWVYSTSGDNFQYVIAKHIDNSDMSYYITTSAGSLHFSVRAGGVNYTASSGAGVVGTSAWHHIVGTYDGTAARIYVNGVLSGTSSPANNAPIDYGTGGSNGYNGDLAIGNRLGGGTSWRGAIDEVMIFDRALALAEVQGVYNARTAGVCPGPTITEFSRDQAANAGSTVQFQVAATAPLPLRYQWQRNGVDLPGETAATLTLANVQPGQAGSYRVIVSTDDATTTTPASALIVYSCVEPPNNLVAWWKGDGNANDSVGALSGAAIGTPAFGFGNVGQAFHTSSGAFRIPDQTRFQSPHVTVSAWVYSASGQGFQHVVAKALDNSNVSYVFISSGPMVFSVRAGGIAYNAVSSESILGTFAWRHVVGTYDGTAARLYIDGVLSGTSSPANNAPIDYGSGGSNGYNGDIAIGNRFAGGNWVGAIDDVMIFDRALALAEVQGVYNARTAGVCPGPTITEFSRDQVANAGSTVRFQVAATAPLPLRYQWQRNGVDLPGETAATLTLANVQPGQAGSYRVIVSTDDATTTTPASALIVYSCVEPPNNLVAWWKGDGNANDVTAVNNGTQSGALAYAPGFIGQAFASSGGFVRVPDHARLRPSTITVSAWVRSTSDVNFQHVLSKAFDNSNGSYGFALWNGSFRFYLRAGGAPYWAASDPFGGDGVWRHITGTYDGSVARVYVNGALAGSSAAINLPIEYAAPGEGDLNIGARSGIGDYWRGGVDEVMIFDRALPLSEIQNIYNARTAGVCLEPVITQQPAGRTLSLGSSARFSISAASALPLIYQWQLNGSDLPGETEAILTLDNISLAQRGLYRVILSSDGGSVVSAEAELVITTPIQPAPTGALATIGDARRVHVVGDFAYVATSNAGLRIVDVTDKANPQLRGSLPSRSTTWDVKVAGNIAYIADGGAGLQLVNISNPASPVRLGEADTTGSANGLDVVGNYAHIADGFSGFAVVDVSNPNAPQIVGTADTPGNANHVSVVGNYAYVADMDRGLQIIDVSVPSNPRIVGSYDTNGEAIDVAVEGNHAFLANATLGLVAINISNPQAPAEAGSYDTGGQAIGISMQGRYAFISDFNEGLKVIDVANPADPTQAYALDTPGESRGVFVAGNYAYIADGAAGLRIIRISETPILPEILEQPRSLRVATGENAVFSVDADADAPLSYEWQFNQVAIPGQTAATLTLASVTEAREGAYRVIVSTPSGSVTSDEVALTVDQCIAAPPGLEGYWPADGVLLNCAGDTRGELLNGATFGEGFGGLAFAFDGFGDGVSLGNETGNFGSADFSVAFWVRGPTFGDETLVSKAVAAEGGFIIATSNGLLEPWVLGINPATGQGAAVVFRGDRRIDDGAWHHAVIIRKQDRVEIHIDGQLDKTEFSSDAGVNVTSSENLTVGASRFFSPFHGSIDELMLFRKALTAAEVAAIYNSGVAGLCPIPVAPAVGRPTGGGDVVQGLPLTLTAVTDGPGPFTYQWRRNGVIIPGATGATYQIVGADAEDAGDYFVVVTGPYGIRAGPPTRVQVMGPPAVAIAPASQAIRVGPGNRLVIQSTISGAGPFTYRWTRDNIELPGATSPRLEISPATADLAGAYRLTVTSPFGSATSDPAAVTIAPALQVTRPPASVQTGEGNPLDLSVEVAGTGPFEFQWRLNGQNISGANLPAYHVDSMRLQDAGQYTVAVTDPGGAVTSDPAEVTLVSVISVEPADAFANAFSLNGQPSQIRTSNMEATRELGEPEHADKPGQHSIWFTWLAPANGQLEIKTVGSSFDTLLGIYKGTAFPLESVAIGDDEGGFATSAALANVENGVRYFIAVDGLGDARGTVLLTWNFRAAAPAPSIRVQPQSVTTTVGAEIRLAIDARDVESYQWRRNEAPIAGATGPDYTILSVQLADLGVYDVVLTGGGVSIASQPVEVQVGTDAEVLAFDKLFDRLNSIDIAAPAPARAAAADPTSPPRAAVGFGSAAAARGLVGVPGSHQDSTIGATRDPGEPNHAGEAGGASTWFVIQADADATMEVTTDGSSYDTVLAIYSGPETVLLFSQLELRAADNNSGANGRTSRVVIPVARNAFYYCAIDGVQGASGFVRINYRLGLAPVIQENPAPQSVLVRGAALMRGSALNADAQDLQWYFNGAPLAGRVGAELQIPDVQSTDAGVYTVVAETFAGRAVSQPATLTVRPAQAIRVSSPTIGANGIRVRVQGGSSQPIRAQASANLINWVEVPVEILPDGTVIVGPAPGLGSGAQFFRIIQ